MDGSSRQSTSSSAVIDLEAATACDDVVLQSTIEPVTPVILKYLQKATIPPPTIKQFFKPKQLQQKNLSAETVTNEKLVSAESLSISRSQVEDENKDGIVSRTNSGACNISVGRTNAIRKRSSSSTTASVVKKQKQSSILSLLTDKSNKSKQANVMNCPICDIVFESNVSNEEFNRHIDNCLIE